MSNDSILVAGGKKCTVEIYPKASDGSPRTFVDVLWWKVSYKRTLILRGQSWTEIFAADSWNRIRIVEE